MAASLVISRNPFDITDREVSVINYSCSIQSISTTIKQNLPFIVILNGEAVLRANWDRLINDGDAVAVVYLPRGGGGGDSNNQLRMVAMMAFMFAVPALAGAFATGTGLLSATATMAQTSAWMSSFAGIAARTVIGVAGMALINHLLPPSKPPSNTPASPSPTYSIQSQGNTARLGQPIPVHYGTLRFYPEYITPPYTRFMDNEMYLHQVLCLGVGEFDTSDGAMGIYLNGIDIKNFPKKKYDILYNTDYTLDYIYNNVKTFSSVSNVTFTEALTAKYSATSNTINLYFDYDPQLYSGAWVYVDTLINPLEITVNVETGYETLEEGIYVFTTTNVFSLMPVYPFGECILKFSSGRDMGAYRFSCYYGVQTTSKIKVIFHDGKLSDYGIPTSIVLRAGQNIGSHKGEVIDSYSYPSGGITKYFVQVRSDGAIGETYSNQYDCKVHTYTGKFYTDSYITDIPPEYHALEIDLVVPSAVGASNNYNLVSTLSFEYIKVDDLNEPLSKWWDWQGIMYTTWSILWCPLLYANSATATLKKYAAYRISQKILVSPGRYMIRARKLLSKSDAYGGYNDTSWVGMKAYLPNTTRFDDVTILALRMQADANSQAQSSSAISVLASRKIPIYDNGDNLSAATGSRIRYVFVDACHNSLYGAGLSYDKIDRDGITSQLISVDYEKTFNGRFDSEITLWEALTRIARTGLAKPYLQAGKVCLYRDKDTTESNIPVALYGMHNIKKDTFSINYIIPTEETADAINVAYFNTYSEPRSVLVRDEDSTTQNPITVNLFGVTNKTQAEADGMYQLKCNKYRRKILKFETELEGFIPSPGDLILIQHDMPSWGQSGEIIADNHALKIITVSEKVDITNYTTPYLAFRKKDGSLTESVVITGVATNANGFYNISLLAYPDGMTPYTGTDYARTQYVLGDTSVLSQRAKVISVTPKGLYDVEISAVNEDINMTSAHYNAMFTPLGSEMFTPSNAKIY